MHRDKYQNTNKKLKLSKKYGKNVLHMNASLKIQINKNKTMHSNMVIRNNEREKVKLSILKNNNDRITEVI